MNPAPKPAPLSRPSRPLPRRAVAVLAGLSVLLHAAGLWLLLPHVPRRGDPSQPPEIEIEMVEQAAKVQGEKPSQSLPAEQPSAPAKPIEAPPSDQPTPAPPIQQPIPTPDPPPDPAPPPAPETPALPPGPDPASPPAPPSPVQPEPTPPERPPAPDPRPPSQAASSIRLGGDDEDQDPLTVTGPHVVPPRPDAAIRNKPPGYPPDAARRRAQGVVTLVAHVDGQGGVAWANVVQSSGDASLDRAAQQAVLLWRFQPAEGVEGPVAFDYPVRFEFVIEGAAGRVGLR